MNQILIEEAKTIITANNNNNNSFRAKHPELTGPKCIEEITMKIEASGREMRNEGDEREAKEPVNDKRMY